MCSVGGSVSSCLCTLSVSLIALTGFAAGEDWMNVGSESHWK